MFERIKSLILEISILISENFSSPFMTFFNLSVISRIDPKLPFTALGNFDGCAVPRVIICLSEDKTSVAAYPTAE